MVDDCNRFTRRAKRVLAHAESEARTFDHNYLGTEHLLLGLAREGEGIGARVLRALEIDDSRLRDAIVYVVGRGEGAPPEKLELVPRANHALELAVEEADRLNHRYIGTEHLLIGLLLEEEGVAAGILAGLGVTLDMARERVDALVGSAVRGQGVRATVERAVRGRRERGSGDVASETRGNVITVRVTDRDLAAIDALIESGIRSTRSDAAAWLIGAGIMANGELLDKLFATIEQIRQLRADAQAIMHRASEGGADLPPESKGKSVG